MLASDLENYNNELTQLNRQLNYLSYIENLAPSIQKNYGMTADQIPSYKPEKLIDVILQL